jgi:hypothetical protein
MWKECADVAIRTLTLRVPDSLVEALSECALREERALGVQTERLIRTGLEQLGYWPPAAARVARPNDSRTAAGVELTLAGAAE